MLSGVLFIVQSLGGAPTASPGGVNCAAARAAAEAAQAEAEEQRLPLQLQRQRRMQVYAEAAWGEEVIGTQNTHC